MGILGGIAGLMGGDSADYYNNVDIPNPDEMKLQLQQYVQQGLLTPEDAQAVVQNPSSFNQIVNDPAFKQAQMQALTGLQDVANQGGLTSIDKARMNDIANQEGVQARGAREAISQNAAERGVGGSGLEFLSQLKNQQSTASDQSNRDTSVAADAQQRALQALVDSGTMAGNIRGQDYSEASQKAAAEDAINRFNAANQQQTNLYNTGVQNQAQATNLAAKQNIADTNTSLANQQQQYNKGLYQQQFQNQLQKAGGQAGASQTDLKNQVQGINQIESGAGNILAGGYDALRKKVAPNTVAGG